jgi:SecD/SecF fusion protein
MDKNLRWKLLSLVVLVGLGIYALIPTIKVYSVPPAARSAQENPVMRNLRSKALKLGLDLQGGMHLVLELDKTNLKPEEVPDALDRAMQILRNRIDQFGVAEPIIQKQGEDRILVQLPGLTDKQRALDLIGQTAELEFKLVKTPAETKQILDRLDRSLAKLQQGEPADSAAADSLAGSHPLIDLLYNYPDVSQQGGVIVLRSDMPKLEKLLASANVDSLVPRDASLAFSSSDESLESGRIMGRVLYVLNRRPELTGASISTAVMKFGLDPNRPNSPGVSMTLNSKGAALFRKVTGANVGRQLAIVLDNKVASAPVIRDRIPSGQAQITGNFSSEEASDLAIILRAGSLPAPIKIAEQRTVGPSLGSDSIRSGLGAGYVGTIVVVLFMLVYYRLSGIIAIVALVLNLFFLFAGMAALRGTLTLPGIAGIVLTVGMAVDSNVLILERIREELRDGKRVRAAVEAGYHRAWRTIIDTHLTNLISAAVLFQFGTGPIKGFAVTLGIGMLANLYTAVLVTKIVYDGVIARHDVRSLSI